MLFRSEAVAAELAAIMRQVQSGSLEKETAVRRLLELDPHYGLGYMLLGTQRAEEGRLDEAESAFWAGLERQPCHYALYLGLADVRRRRDSGDALAPRLATLAIRMLATAEEISAPIAEIFREHFAAKLGLDYADPSDYAAIAELLQRGERGNPEPPAIAERLLPYRLLAALREQAAGVMSAGLLDEIRSQPAVCAPILHAALREWGRSPVALDDRAAAVVAALLGEIAEAAVLEDLLELASIEDASLFRHAHWAIWRLGQRHPAGALEIFQRAAPGAPLPRRCAIADHLGLLPPWLDVQPALAALLEDFAAVARQGDAPYLLLAAAAMLRARGQNREAEELIARHEPLLPRKARSGVRETLDSEQGFVPRLIKEGIVEVTLEEICLEGLLMVDEDERDDEFEEEPEDHDLEEVEPQPAAVRPGRNEPCWCGSGKKYKKCHLSADEQADLAGASSADRDAPGTGGSWKRLIHAVLTFATERHTPADMEEAKRLYFGEQRPKAKIEVEESEGENFLQWLLFDFRAPSTGRTPVEEYLQSESARLDPRQRELLESWRRARFGVWEVQRVEEGRGVELKDVFTGDRFFVHDVSSSRSLVRWDCLVSRVVEEDGRNVFAGNGWIVPRELRDELLEWMEAEHAGTALTAAEFVRANSHRLHRAVAAMRERRFANLKVVNAEGDPIEFCAATYEIQDEEAALRGLRSCREFEEDRRSEKEGRRFAWLEPGTGDGRRAYGSLELRKGRLRLECNSRNRLERGRGLIEAHAAGAVRHLGDSFESLAAAGRRAAGADRAPEHSEVPDEIRRELLLKVKEEHYAKWADEVLPALGGLTPRAAVWTRAGRKAVRDLLRDIENHEERLRREGEAAYDVSALRRELGLPPE